MVRCLLTAALGCCCAAGALIAAPAEPTRKSPAAAFDSTDRYTVRDIDFYPFVRAELARHDRALYDLLGKMWHDLASPKDTPEPDRPGSNALRHPAR